MHNSVDNLITIQKEIQKKISEIKNFKTNPNIIAVSKTFQMNDILPLINYGHLNFGENKVQEAIIKWTDVKKDFDHIKLHMIGKLQTNKVKYVIPLFDYIHTLDNIKLAEKIYSEQIKNNKKLKIFIQVNVGNESQKNGISSDKLEDFYNECKINLGLDIIGLMCLPPNDNDPNKYFSQLYNFSKKLNLQDLSMGMSQDYLKAVENGSSYLRIGSKIFGHRG
jgi:pyridoxal phosphate enzyme (YggS family)